MAAALFQNFCRWLSTTHGTAAFTVGAAASNDDLNVAHDTPENCFVINGAPYLYLAQSPDGSIFERGRGIYNTTTHVLARALVLSNSDGTTDLIDFPANPIVDMFPRPYPGVELKPIPPIFDIGTKVPFQQTSAPTHWTKQTTHNDKALRVVSGTASSGGSNAFSTVFAQTTTGNHTLSLSEIASHAHNNPSQTGAGAGPSTDLMRADDTGIHTNLASDANGGGGAHNHPITMSIQFVDLIIASYDG